jgi:hypothetical protein
MRYEFVNKLLTIFFFFFWLVLYQNGYGMGGQEHIAFWYECFGIDKTDTESRIKLEPLFQLIQKEIDWVFRKEDSFDDAGEEYLRFWRNLKAKYPDFKTFEYRHRLFFHWGFNTKLKYYEPLKTCLKKLKYSDEQIDGIYRMIEKENDKRKERILKKIMQTTGMSRLYSKALATILYDIHILSDWETGNGLGLMSIDQLRTEILYYGYKYLCNDENLYKEIRREIIPARTAKDINELNRKYLSIVLYENFNELLKQNGINIQKTKSEAIITR